MDVQSHFWVLLGGVGRVERLLMGESLRPRHGVLLMRREEVLGISWRSLPTKLVVRLLHWATVDQGLLHLLLLHVLVQSALPEYALDRSVLLLVYLDAVEVQLSLHWRL